MLEFLISYWWVLIIAIAIGGVASVCIWKFFSLPFSKQLTKVQEWLLYAVTEAEKELGSGTGQLKLRYVYDMFLKQFPKIAKVISFETFSELVDTALEKFRNILDTNKQVQNYVNEK